QGSTRKRCNWRRQSLRSLPALASLRSGSHDPSMRTGHSAIDGAQRPLRQQKPPESPPSRSLRSPELNLWPPIPGNKDLTGNWIGSPAIYQAGGPPLGFEKTELSLLGLRGGGRGTWQWNRKEDCSPSVPRRVVPLKRASREAPGPRQRKMRRAEGTYRGVPVRARATASEA